MPLILHRREFGHDQFSVYEGELYIGRIYKTSRGDGFWGLDHSAAGNRLINGHAVNSALAVATLKGARNGPSRQPALAAPWCGKIVLN